VVVVVELEQDIPLLVTEDRVEQDLSLVEMVVMRMLMGEVEGDQ
jgi:hypothetical protein